MNRGTTIRRVNLLLVLVAIVLANLVSTNSFFRWDLTRTNAYSLSRVSRETLSRLEDPLRVTIFYNEEVPAPYNGVRRYLMDILREFENTGNRFFTVEVIDPSSEEGRAAAQGFGLQQVELQEIRSDEFASRAVYMGAVVQYGNVVERVDQLVTTTGLEYRLATAMRSAITQVDALSGTTEPVEMWLIASPQLDEIQIQGFTSLADDVEAMHQRINRDNFNRIAYRYEQPRSAEEISALDERFGVRRLEWSGTDGTMKQGVLEVVLSYQDRVERLPLEIYSQLFGGYVLDDPAVIEEAVRDELRSLVAANPRIAYSTTAGERALDDPQSGAEPFATIVGQSYELLPVNLREEPIPAGIDTLVLNGAQGAYTEEALYRIDQFLMRGGSLLAFVDRHTLFQLPETDQFAGMQPQWIELDSGINRLLRAYGAEVGTQLVLDEESFIARSQFSGRQQLFQAPVISGAGVNRESVITGELEDIIVLTATEISPTETAARYTPLLQTSQRSWLVDSPQMVGSWITGAPTDGELRARDVAVLLEGEFESAFDEAVAMNAPPAPGEAAGGAADAPGQTDVSSPENLDRITVDMTGGRFRRRSVEPGRVMVVSSSLLTTPQMLDPRQATPNSTFLLNAVDYLNGAPGIAQLRGKGLGVPRLDPVEPMVRTVVRWSNTVLVPVVVVVVGLFVWSRRRARAAGVRRMFSSETEGTR